MIPTFLWCNKREVGSQHLVGGITTLHLEVILEVLHFGCEVTLLDRFCSDCRCIQELDGVVNGEQICVVVSLLGSQLLASLKSVVCPECSDLTFLISSAKLSLTPVFSSIVLVDGEISRAPACRRPSQSVNILGGGRKSGTRVRVGLLCLFRAVCQRLVRWIRLALNHTGRRPPRQNGTCRLSVAHHKKTPSGKCEGHTTDCMARPN